MSHKPDAGVTSCVPPGMTEEIRAQIERVLNSHQFRGSKRCQSLLRHIAEHTLAGDAHVLKERTLGVEVFGRLADYDTSQDPVVRSTAAEIRKKLAQYYQEKGHETEIRVEVLPGSYVPEFHEPSGVPDTTLRRWKRRVLYIAATTVAVSMAIVLVFVAPRWFRSDLDRFWNPLVKAAGPVLVCVGQPVAYNLVSPQAQDEIQFAEAAPQTNTEVANVSIPKQDLIIMRDRYVALGDAVCLSRLTGLFERLRKPYRIRGERSTSSTDLGEGPAVLIAAFDNRWSLRAAGQLRFIFVKDSAHSVDMIRDRQHPEKTNWKLTGAWPLWDIPNDYAIVSRILDVNTDRPVVLAAGITQYGTMAAGEFLTDKAQFAEAARNLPGGWEKKNLQFVLRVPVMHGAVGHPRVEATHVW